MSSLVWKEFLCHVRLHAQRDRNRLLILFEDFQFLYRYGLLQARLQHVLMYVFLSVFAHKRVAPTACLFCRRASLIC